ncbi:MAG: lipid II flippase MurJ, partial [Rhizonema sp. PD38]|nr:lipid II flippase MurJ [Rhizonema sp. PD38]
MDRANKATVCANLAASMAQAGHRVLLVDADMHCPLQHRIWELPNQVGLSNVIIGKIELSIAITKQVMVNLDVLTSGLIPPNPKALLASQRLASLMEEFGDALDAFLIALVVPDFIINVVAGSFNAALIPTYIQVREHEGNKAAQRLFSGTTLWSLGLLLITTLLIVVTAPLYLSWIARGFSPEKLDLTFRLICMIAPVVLLYGIITIWSAVLNAGERFALAALTPIISPTITIVFLLVGQSWGIYAIAAGLFGGALLEVFFLGAALYRQGISLLPRWYGFDSHLRQVASQYIPSIAGSFLMCSTGLVDQSMAAMLSPGSVAALNYGNRVIAFPITLITTALSTAVIPYFSKMIACQEWTRVHYTLKHYMRLIFAVSVPLTGLLLIFSELIVQILFQRGSFTASDTHLVAQIQSFFALQIPVRCLSILVVRLISAMRNNQILVWGSSCNLIVNIVLNYLFVQYLSVSG